MTEKALKYFGLGQLSVWEKWSVRSISKEFQGNGDGNAIRMRPNETRRNARSYAAQGKAILLFNTVVINHHIEIKFAFRILHRQGNDDISIKLFAYVQKIV